jgi:amino acid adenylation domain-containing protein
MHDGLRRLEKIFRQTVAQFSDRSAVVDEEAVWSYQALDRLTATMARQLQAVGVHHGDRVGLWAPRSAACLATMLGILRLGAAYVPADSAFPARRVTGMLADCDAAALVCTAALRARLPDVRCPVVFLGHEAHDVAALPSPAPVVTSLDDLAYIIYTSGTTGTPKGVAISHRNIGHLVEAEAQVFGITPEDRVFHGFSIAFDASLEEIWLALRAGATLVIGSSAVVRSGPGLSAFLTRMQVSVFSCVPTLLAMLEPDLASVRLLIVGAEACPPELVRRWARPGRRMVNTYGPTETTVVATWADLTPDLPVRIGRPLPGWTVHVVDEQLRPVPCGTAGELLIGGPGVAVGYLNRPDLTQQKFLCPAWSAERLYRSGDRVQMDAQGLLEFLGRTDEQVKLRGFRVELGEIESVLLAYPGVACAAVTVHRAPETEELLAAYVTLRPGSAWEEAGMRQALRRLLPPYMVPATITVLSELPSLPGGKVDRRALPLPTGGQGDTTPPPGLSATQALVWSLWRQ